MPVQFDFIWSTRYFPVYPVSESCLDVIKYYYLSLRPRLRVPVPPSCVHRDNMGVLRIFIMYIQIHTHKIYFLKIFTYIYMYIFI